MKTTNVFLLSSILIFSMRLFAGDLKIKSVVTFTNKTADTYKTSESARSSQYEETVYVQGSRERREYRVPDTIDVRQPHTAQISDCHTLIGYLADLNSRKYMEMKLPGFPSEEQMQTAIRQQKEWAMEHYSTQTTDTGETKTVFGLTAHHIITSVHGIAPHDRSEATIDGWYINLPRPGCSPDYLRQGKAAEIYASFLTAKATKNVYTGFVPPGLTVEETVTTRSRFDKKGVPIEVVTVVKKKVVELSQETQDPSLFSVPEGFEKVEQLPWNVDIPLPALRTR